MATNYASNKGGLIEQIDSHISSEKKPKKQKNLSTNIGT